MAQRDRLALVGARAGRRRRLRPARRSGRPRRVVHAEPAALDHRRAAHADARVLGRDHHVAAAEQRGVAGEAVAGGDADERHEAAQRGEQLERAAVEARRRSACRRRRGARRRPRRTARPAAGGARRARTGGPSWRGCASPACPRAPCSRRTSPRTGGRRRRPTPPTSPSAGVRAISSSRDAPALLRGEQQRPVLDEAARVDQIGEVLARRAPAALAAARDRLAGAPRRARPRGARAPRAGRRARRVRSRAASARARRRRAAVARARLERRSAADPPRRRRRPPPPRSRTTPSTRASTSCSIFIASSTTSGAPGADLLVGAVRNATTTPANGASRELCR